MSQGQVTTSRSTRDVVAENFRAELASRNLEVPLLPNVAAEVLSSSLDEQSNALRLAELIQQDQGLASHMLRVVNSPAFRGQTEIVALQQAIARLGMERIRELALTVSLKGTLFKPGPFDYLVSEAWQHGLRTGLWAKEIARSARKNVEIAYLCGLLHNVGASLVVNRVFQLDENLTEADVRSLEAEFAQEAGLLLVEEWGLPAAVGLSIRFLDDLENAKNAQDTTAIVIAASFLAQRQIHDALEVEAVLQEPSLQHLNFYPDEVGVLLEHAEKIQQTVDGMA
jgi:HD-like signal output (HDOD) protein